MEGGELPIVQGKHSQTSESVGTTVLLPDDNKDLVVKVGKSGYSARPWQGALSQIQLEREQERIALSIASERTKKAIVTQEYVLADGVNPGEARSIRTQKYQDGQPLKKLGFWKIMNLDHENIETLKSILLDSAKCYLKTGKNYDISGSDERDALKDSRMLRIKRMFFPLRNSSNIFLTPEGIKLLDPNVIHIPKFEGTIKLAAFQLILFCSTLADYSFLTIAHKLKK